MAEFTKETIFEGIINILNMMSDDWEYADEIRLETYLIADLGFESIDIVVLGTTIEKQYKRSLPFAKFFAEIGQREIRDIRLDELVGFVYGNLNRSDAAQQDISSGSCVSRMTQRG